MTPNVFAPFPPPPYGCRVTTRPAAFVVIPDQQYVTVSVLFILYLQDEIKNLCMRCVRDIEIHVAITITAITITACGYNKCAEGMYGVSCTFRLKDR